MTRTARHSRHDTNPVARDAMLNAAEEVVIRRGIGALTLDAVAEQAGLSKSGLLHHFHSKDALIDAMVRRKVAAWRDQCAAAIERQPPGPGRVPRAILSNCLSSAEKWTETQRRSCRVLVAALVHSPSVIEPLRQAHRDMAARIADDGLPPGVGETVMLAVDGLWFDWLLGIAEPSPAKLARIRATLERIIASAQRSQSPRPHHPPSTPRRAAAVQPRSRR